MEKKVLLQQRDLVRSPQGPASPGGGGGDQRGNDSEKGEMTLPTPGRGDEVGGIPVWPPGNLAASPSGEQAQWAWVYIWKV